MLEIDRYLKLPADLRLTLEKLNAQKKGDAPAALILWGSRDFNGFLSTASTHSQVLQIAKTHKVAIKAIDDAAQLGQKIESAKTLLGRDISLLTIIAHGEADRLYLGGRSIFNFFSKRKPEYQESDIKREDFSSLASNAKIALYSCNTGNGLAQKIADTANRIVFAPTRDLYDAATCFPTSKRDGIKMLSYNEKGAQHVFAFKPRLSPELLSPETIQSKSTQTAFATMACYLKKRASEGDVDAQCKLGFFYEKGLGGLEQSDIEAKKWFHLAAAHGSGLAQFYLGLFYLNGDGGLVQSDKKAAFLFKLSAIQSIPESIYNLGVLYEYGRGVRQSNEEAARLYRMAYKLGIQDAANRLSCVVAEQGSNNKEIQPAKPSLIRGIGLSVVRLLVVLDQNSWSNFDVKAPRIDYRKSGRIELILLLLRSSILGSFHARNCFKNFGQGPLDMVHRVFCVVKETSVKVSV